MVNLNYHTQFHQDWSIHFEMHRQTGNYICEMVNAHSIFISLVAPLRSHDLKIKTGNSSAKKLVLFKNNANHIF